MIIRISWGAFPPRCEIYYAGHFIMRPVRWMLDIRNRYRKPIAPHIAKNSWPGARWRRRSGPRDNAMRQDDNIAAISTTCRACARARATDVGARERNLQFAVLRAFNKHRKRLDKNPIDDGDDDDDDANGRKAAGRQKRGLQRAHDAKKKKTRNQKRTTQTLHIASHFTYNTFCTQWAIDWWNYSSVQKQQCNLQQSVSKSLYHPPMRYKTRCHSSFSVNTACKQFNPHPPTNKTIYILPVRKISANLSKKKSENLKNRALQVEKIKYSAAVWSLKSLEV